MSLLEAWTDSGLTVIIDAAIADPSTPGRIRRCGLAEVATRPEGLSSHRLDIGRTYALAQALGRVPGELLVFTVEVPDAGHGIGMTPPVAAAVPTVVDMVRAEVDRALR
jgi:hydrogenase maturation protease